jgi:hypothetical protein
MAEAELPDAHTVTVEVPSDVFAAAGECSESPAQWIDGAIQMRLDDRAAAQQAASQRRPGPWPGWETYSSAAGEVESLTYHGPEGMEVHYSRRGFSGNRPYWLGASSRPWMARTADGCLHTRDRKIRVFRSAEAARNALESQVSSDPI